MNRIVARSKALRDAVQAVDNLHQSVVEYGSDSTQTDTAADKANEAVATAKRFGITTTDIGRASATT